MAVANQENYILRNGMGTVSAADYEADPEKYGPVVEESNDEYQRRLREGRFADQQPVRPALAGAAPMTTIANLATFDPGAQPRMSPIPPIPPMWIRVEDLDRLEERVAAKAAPEQRRRA